jgi:hypothetical protein
MNVACQITPSLTRAEPPSCADEDPLPSFEKRQALAAQLDMSPRSVQIWFQNRRQRLLKNNAQPRPTQSNCAWPSPRSNEIAHVAPTPRGLEVMPSPRTEPSEGSQSGHGSGDDDSQANQPSRAHPASFLPMHVQHPYPVMAFLANNLSAAIQYEAEHAGRTTGDAGDIDLQSTLAALPHAVAAGHVDAGASHLLAEALQQQLANGPAPAQQQQQPPFCFPPRMEPSPPTCPTGGGQRAQWTARQHPGRASGEVSALDGLLMLSACADVPTRTPEAAAPPAAAAHGSQALAAAQAALLNAALMNAGQTAAASQSAAAGLVQGVTLLPPPVVQGVREQFATATATPSTAAPGDNLFMAYEVLDVQPPARQQPSPPSGPFAPAAAAAAAAAAHGFPTPCLSAAPSSGR